MGLSVAKKNKIKEAKAGVCDFSLVRAFGAVCLFSAMLMGGLSQAFANDAPVVKIKTDPSAFADAEMVRFLPRIVGGEISQNNYPWMISLQRVLANGGSAHICGGSFIDNRWVLTAAHCVFGVAPNNFRIIANTNQLNNPNAAVFNVKAIHVHEDYNPANLLNDIALIELFQPANVLGLIEPANEDYMNGVVENDIVTVSGWGALEQGNPNLPNDLYEVDVPVRTQPQCLQAYPGAASILAGTTICAGIDAGGIDSCQGDSGGPLFQPDGGGYKQVGIVSWGEGCALPGKYGVYTRVASYEDWINGFVKGLFFEGPPFVGYVGVNTTASRLVFIRNNGDVPVNADSVTLGGLNAGNFDVDASDCIGAPIQPGQVCTLQLSATATVPGELTATVTANLDSQVTPEITLQIFATGLPALAEGPAALDTDDALVFSGQDGPPWFAEADALAEGGQSLMSGAINNNQVSVATAVVQGPGTVSFSYSVSSEQDYDKLLVLHNGELIVDASGEVAFTEVTRTLVPGENHLTFGYIKDVTEAVGADAAWIDNMVVVTEEVVVEDPDGEIVVDDNEEEEVEEEVVAAATTLLQAIAFLMLLLSRRLILSRFERKRS